MAQTVCVLPDATDTARLAAIARDRSRPLKHILRARIVLLSAECLSVQDVARQAGVRREKARKRTLRTSACSTEQLLSSGPQVTVRRDVPIERLAGDAEFGAQVGDPRLGLTHRRLGEAELGRRHLERASAVPAAGAGGRQPGLGALDDQFAPELGQPGEDCEHEAAVGRGGVDRSALAGRHLQADVAPCDVADQVDEVAQVAAEPV